MPSLKVIKAWVIGALAVGAAVLFGLWKASQLGRVKDKVSGIKRARRIEKAVSKSTVEALQREHEELSNISTKRDDFN